MSETIEEAARSSHSQKQVDIFFNAAKPCKDDPSSLPSKKS